MIMQIGSPLAEIHIKNTHLTYTVAAPAPQSRHFWGARGKTHLHRENVPKSLQMRHRVDLNT